MQKIKSTCSTILDVSKIEIETEHSHIVERSTHILMSLRRELDLKECAKRKSTETRVKTKL